MKQLLDNQTNWIKRRSRGWMLGAALGLLPAGHAQAPRFSITSEQVVAAMQGHAWPTGGVRVTLPAAVTAAVADPKLGVVMTSMLTAHEARLRIVCRVPAACLPFYATATWPESAEPVAPLSDKNTGSGERKTPASAAEKNESSAGRLRAGASVTLLLEGERVHIQIQAVCLQGGAAGEKVRVASRDRKQTFVAEIVNPTLLKGSLPQ